MKWGGCALWVCDGRMFQAEGMANCRLGGRRVECLRKGIQGSVDGTQLIGEWGVVEDEIREIVRDQFMEGLGGYGKNLVLILTGSGGGF